MNAIHLHTRGGPGALVHEQAPTPWPGVGEVLVRVHAAAVTPTELDRRGVFIFKVDSLCDAQALTDTDPAVIAGRLKIVLYKWSVPKGMLP